MDQTANVVTRGYRKFTLCNTPFPSSPQPLFGSESKCEIFLMVIVSNFNEIEKIFMTDFALSLALKWRLRWTRKWPIVNVFHSHWLIRSNFRLRWSDNIWVNLVLVYTTHDPILIYESSVSRGDRTQRIGRKKKVKEFQKVNPFIMKMPVFTVRNKCKIHSEVFSLKFFRKKAFWNI